MKLIAMLVLTALPFGILAAQCDKIEYAEAKDWTPQELETQACAAFHGMMSNMSLSAEVSKKYGVLDPVSTLYDNRGTVCMKQYELYVRILKNVHHREYKTCK